MVVAVFTVCAAVVVLGTVYVVVVVNVKIVMSHFLANNLRTV